MTSAGAEAGAGARAGARAKADAGTRPAVGAEVRPVVLPQPGDGLGVLLDIDDTLVDTAAAFGAAINAVVAAYLPHLDAEQTAAALLQWRTDPSGHYRAYTRGEKGFDEQRHARANELHQTFGGPELDEAGYRAWLEIFWGTFASAWRAHDDATALLDALDAAGVRYGAVTNAKADLQLGKLASTGLSRVPVLVAVDTFGVGKPDGRVFLEGCRVLGAAPEVTVYVGDELDIDAMAAGAAGLRGVWLSRPGHHDARTHDADRAAAAAAGVTVVGSLTELTVLLGLADAARG